MYAGNKYIVAIENNVYLKLVRNIVNKGQLNENSSGGLIIN